MPSDRAGAQWLIDSRESEQRRFGHPLFDGVRCNRGRRMEGTPYRACTRGEARRRRGGQEASERLVTANDAALARTRDDCCSQRQSITRVDRSCGGKRACTQSERRDFRALHQVWWARRRSSGGVRMRARRSRVSPSDSAGMGLERARERRYRGGYHTALETRLPHARHDSASPASRNQLCPRPRRRVHGRRVDLRCLADHFHASLRHLRLSLSQGL